MNKHSKVGSALYDAKESLLFFGGIIFSGVYVTGLMVSEMVTDFYRGSRSHHFIYRKF